MTELFCLMTVAVAIQLYTLVRTLRTAHSEEWILLCVTNKFKKHCSPGWVA